MENPVTDIGKALNVRCVALRGIVSAVPDAVVGNAVFEEKFGAKAVAEISRMTGVQSRRVASANQTTADLAEAAARQLLQKLQWDSESIDAIVFVSQTPDYRLPATACALQARLQLPAHCAAFDINLGCSGYVYGLWVASKLIDGAGIRRVLLLAGDTSTKLVNPEDRATSMLFGDAGTATAIEFDETAAPSWYVLGTDGGGEKNLIFPRSQYRSALPAGEKLSAASPDHLYMDGAEVFNFTIRSVPLLINQVLRVSDKDISDLTYVLFHQANAFMLKHIAKKLSLRADQFPMNIDRFGNTSSASIPLLLASLGSEVRTANDVVLAGFGVGYSWAAVQLSLNGLEVCDLLEVKS